MKNLLTRTLTGLLFVAVLIGATVSSAQSFVILFAIATALTVWEFSTVVNLHAGASVNRFINTVAAVYLFFCFCDVFFCQFQVFGTIRKVVGNYNLIVIKYHFPNKGIYY